MKMVIIFNNLLLVVFPVYFSTLFVQHYSHLCMCNKFTNKYPKTCPKHSQPIQKSFNACVHN